MGYQQHVLWVASALLDLQLRCNVSLDITAKTHQSAYHVIQGISAPAAAQLLSSARQDHSVWQVHLLGPHASRERIVIQGCAPRRGIVNLDPLVQSNVLCLLYHHLVHHCLLTVSALLVLP